MDIMERLTRQLYVHEGYRRYPYKDTKDILTIGIGRNLEHNGISLREAYFLLENDLKITINGLRQVLPWWDTLDPVRQIVLADMAFNIGVSGLMKFRRMLTHLAASDYERAAEEMLRSLWAQQVHSRAEHLWAMMTTGEWNEQLFSPTK